MKTLALQPKLFLCFFFLSSIQFLNAQCADLVVAQDGSGDYATVQEAIEAAPANLTAAFVIYIKDGVYDEKLFIERNHITLIGESRDSTIITTAVLRRIWRENNPNDWGAATVNVANDATDLTLANMTIRNNFADVFPNTPDPNDHTFAIRGGGHRVIIYNCNVITTGGDTLSLWNTNGGMFYHNNCFFEGYVDYVAPRGYCYITDCEFYGYNNHASIWHDGSGGEDHKLVIRRSNFDGVVGFALGRHHKEAAFYLLDCHFEENMKTSQGIVYVGTDPLVWGERYYYHNTHWDLVDFPWQYDNLEDAAGSPAAEEIDALWTFNGEWDAEAQLDGLLPFASMPSPRSGDACASLEPTLSWVGGHCAISYNVFFGETSSPSYVDNVVNDEFQPDPLQAGQMYYWRVDAVTATDTIAGEVWQFAAETNDGTPYQVFNPAPADGADYFTNLVKLDWDYHLCSTDSFDVYVGFAPDQLEKVDVQKYPGYFIFQSQDDSTYYWRVDAKNGNGITEGPVWSFTLNPTPSASSEISTTNFYLNQNAPNPFHDTSLITYGLPDSGAVELALYDLQGQVVKRLFQGEQQKGAHQFMLKNGGLPKGVYVCRLLFNGRNDRFIKVLID